MITRKKIRFRGGSTVSDATGSETEVTAYWNRIATYVRGACALVERDGRPVLVKFDGMRENGKIYTVVRDAVTYDDAAFIRNGSKAEEAFFRADSSDLEDALSRVLGPDITATTSPTDELAQTLRTFDSLAKRGFIIGMRIVQNDGRVNFDLFLSRGSASLG
jgi:hypothetical protein